MSQTGKAFIYRAGEGSDFKWDSKFKFKQPSKNEVLLKVISAGINPIDYKLPHIPFMGYGIKGSPVGKDVCGEVVAVGSGVSDFKVGDKVFGNGPGVAEYCLTAPLALAKIPEGAVDFAVYGGLGVAVGTAYQMLELGSAFTGMEPKHIMIIGASGGVGSAAVQIAKAKCATGTRIFAVCSGKSADYVKSIGADSVIDYSSPNFDFSKCVPEKSFDAVIDCVTSPENFNYKPDGMKFIKENTGKYIATSSTSMFDWIKLGIGSTLGIKLFRGQYQPMLYSPRRDVLEELGRLVHEKKIVVNVQEYVPFEESAIKKAFETLKGLRVRGKLIVKM
jgi:NADPH:quinone reductase-like Zn-dependent oxidoreductase